LDVVERIRRQARLVEELLGELEVERSYRGVERLVQLIIQALLDLGLMVIAALGGRRPEAYSEIGVVLRELNVIGDEEALMMKSMAGLRNLLVHAYRVVDRDKVVEFAERLKTDAPRLTSRILRGVEGKNVDPPGLSVGEVVERVRGVLAGKVTLAFLYGGRVKGYTLKGDYDIAVLMEPTCSLYKLGELAVDIARALGVREEDVDVKCIDMLPPEHALEALNGIPIVVDSPTLAFNLKYRMLVELLDLKEGINVTLKQPRPT
jgi:uncharacterized protein YutE (UPF0331/DUF86 family)/predicted nucleotidyltransferase